MPSEYCCRGCKSTASDTTYAGKPHLPADWAEIVVRHRSLTTHLVLCPECVPTFWAQVSKLRQIRTIGEVINK